jgi:hypothetical protein
VRAGGVTIALRETRRELYITCTMTSNNANWERGWFYLRDNEPGQPPCTGKVMREKADSWWHSVSPSSRQDRLDSALKVLKALADAGQTAASVLANLHHRRVVPLMERRLRIFEMEETADPVALTQPRLRPHLFSREYAATRARRAINLRATRIIDTALWAFTMLPEGPLVRRVSTPLRSFSWWTIAVIRNFTRPLQVMDVNAARSDPPTPRARARARGAAARARAGGTQEGEEYPATGAPGTEERGVSVARAAGALLPRDFGVLVVGRRGGERRGSGSPERWEPSPPSPRAAEAAEETAPGIGAEAPGIGAEAPGAGAGAPAARHPTREATRAAGVPARAAEMAGGEAAATAPAEPPRKRKRGFSTLR